MKITSALFKLTNPNWVIEASVNKTTYYQMVIDSLTVSNTWLISRHRPSSGFEMLRAQCYNEVDELISDVQVLVLDAFDLTNFHGNLREVALEVLNPVLDIDARNWVIRVHVHVKDAETWKAVQERAKVGVFRFQMLNVHGLKVLADIDRRRVAKFDDGR